MTPRVLPLALLAVTPLLHAAAGPDFHDRLGLQLWSVRATMKQSEAAALDLTEITGVAEVETAGTGRLPVAQFAGALHEHHLNAVSAHIGYDLLKKDIAGVIRDAKTLGAQYVICPSLPHGEKPWTAADAHRVAAEFNTWGEACRAAGLQFGYHTHGFEFMPTGHGDERAFDVLMRETKPELVCFEMDVFWVAHAGQDPVALLRRYPDRWRLMHVKDMRKGAPTGLPDGRAPATDAVAVGRGQLDWPAILRAAHEIGVEHYFLEDETPSPLRCIPDSLQYLRTLQL